MRYLAASIVSILLCVPLCYGQSSSRIGFYNLENLYDTINDPSVDDGRFLDDPNYNYEAKLLGIASAIELFSPDILGLCEAENYGVLEALNSKLSGEYSIVHYDSRDNRGIDVALLYNPTKYKLVASELIYIEYLWRDLLRVELCAEGSEDPFVLYVVHLPSRRGGAEARRLRQRAVKDLDSLALSEHSSKVILLGDFNDNPEQRGVLYNCAEAPFNKGLFSYIYGDVPTMYDQIIVTPELRRSLLSDQIVVSHRSLIAPSGRFKGYPRKGAPSDHLPIYIDIRLE